MAYKDPNDPRSKAAKQKHYLQNKEKYIKQAKENKEKLKQLVRDLKEDSPCTDCRQQYPYYIMQYDHIGTDKTSSISRMVAGGSRQRLLQELQKCELVCANCHAARTYKRISGSAG